MRVILISILTLSSFINLSAQGDEKVFEKIEIIATTNQKAWNQHIIRKSHLTDSALNNIPPGTYKVNVQFIIDKHGSIGQVEAKNDPGYDLAKKAVNIISCYKGTWKPAVQCGRPVKAYRTQQITFTIPAQ